jgi:hypothetical protein
MISLRLRLVLGVVLSSALSVGCGSSGKSAPTDGPRDTPASETVQPDGGADSPADGSPQEDAADSSTDSSTLPDVANAPDAAPDSLDASSSVATIFLNHAINNAIYRYAISPGADPVLNATISAMRPEGLAMNAKGELFAASEDGSVLRFTTPLATPTPNGKLGNLGVIDPEQMAFVDDELWIPSTDYTTCLTTASSITRVAFDAAGVGTVAGTVQALGIVTAGRGVWWDAPSRTLYLSDCHAVDTIQPYHVANAKTISALAAATGGGINNPHGMIVAPWGELFVSNAGAAQILRFVIGATGALAANGNISGNGLNFPIGLTFAPWGELFVVDQGSGSLSRFTFDAAHVTSPNGIFATGLDSTAASHNLGWILMVPAASTPSQSDAGADGASGAEAGSGG